MPTGADQLRTSNSELWISPCRLCPRECAVDRAAGERGFCRAGAQAQVFRFGPHHGEEPPLSGTRGSGTVFFSRCTLACLYCQNHPWSQEGRGTEYDVAGLAGILRDLAGRGCHNWNLVSPTPWLPMVVDALALLHRDGLHLPVVMNTSGFERPETLDALEPWVDVYLTDLRYATPATAEEGSGRADYAAVARDALLRMWGQKGPLRTDADGLARSGVICRMLVLPGRVEEAVANLEWLAEHVGRQIHLSLMSQYTPAHRAPTRAGWDRPITRAEYDQVTDTLARLDLPNGWIQDYEEPAPAELLGYRMAEEKLDVGARGIAPEASDAD